MSSTGNVKISIETSDDFEPTARLVAALEALAGAYEAQTGTAIEDTGGDDVSGFAMRLKVGDLRADGPRPGHRVDRWNDGCWGYNEKDGSCGWFVWDDESCVAFKW